MARYAVTTRIGGLLGNNPRPGCNRQAWHAGRDVHDLSLALYQAP